MWGVTQIEGRNEVITSVLVIDLFSKMIYKQKPTKAFLKEARGLLDGVLMRVTRCLVRLGRTQMFVCKDGKGVVDKM